MQIAIIKKSDLNECFSALQYTDNCHQCDKLFSCKINSTFHENGLLRKEEQEINKILAENEERLNRLRNNVKTTLSNIKK